MPNYELPVDEEHRLWVDDGFKRLDKALGRNRMLNAHVVLPTPEFFPNEYDGSEEAVADFFATLCGYMDIGRTSVDLEFNPVTFEKVFSASSDRRTGKKHSKTIDQTDSNDPPSENPSEDEEAEKIANGTHIYHPDHTIESTEGRKARSLSIDHKNRCGGPEVWVDDPSRIVISVGPDEFSDTVGLAARFVHLLCHAIVFQRDLIDTSFVDAEELTNLLAVYVGMGIFTANAALRFQNRLRKYPMHFLQEGVLSQETYGYALAKFAVERGEEHPLWAKYLCEDVREYYKRSRNWLACPHDEDAYGEI